MSQFSLRPLEEKDAERMLEWMRDPEITRFLQIGGPDTSRDKVLSFINNAVEDRENLHMAIVTENDEYQGTVSLKHIDYSKKEAEYAITLHASALGSGAAREGTEQILKLAFQQMGLNRVYLFVQKNNTRANRFYEKCGFKKTYMSSMIIRNRKRIVLWYEINKNSRM